MNRATIGAAMLLASTALSLDPKYALAQEARAAGIGGVQSDADIGEIVVTAQRREASLARTPVAVAALTSDDIVKRGLTTEADLQRSVAGLTVRENANSDWVNYSIRGQTIDSFTSSQPAVQPYINDLPLMPGYSSAFFDIESIQVLKGGQGTLFGRNSTGGAVLFTTKKPGDTLGGYINQKVGNFGYLATEGALDVPLGSDTLMLRIAGNYIHRSGYTRNLFDGKRLGRSNRLAFRGTLAYSLGDAFANTLVVDYSRSRGRPNPAILYSAYAPGSTYNGAPLNATVPSLYSPEGFDAAYGASAWDVYVQAHPGVDPQGILHYLELQRERGPRRVSLNSPTFMRNKQLQVSNTTELELSQDVKLKNLFSYTRTRLQQSTDLDGTPFGVQGPNPSSPWIVDKGRQFVEELQIVATAFDKKLSLVGGIFYFDYKLDNNTQFDVFDVKPFGLIHVNFSSINATKSYAAYAQGTYDLSSMGLEGLGITAGARYTRDKASIKQLPDGAYYNVPGFFNSLSKNFDEVSYHFGIQQQASRELFLYAVHRRSFRGGGFNTYAPSLPGTAAAGGALFNPEISKDVEIGAKFQGRLGSLPLRLNVALYKQWVDDVQRSIYVVTDVGPSGLTANVPQMQTEGFEMDGEIRPAEWLRIGGTAAYTKARFTKPSTTLFGQTTVYGPYPDTPRWAGSAFTEVNFPLAGDVGRLVGRVDVFAQTSNWFSSVGGTLAPETKLPGYTLVDLRLGVEDMMQGKLSISGSMKNVANKEYWAGGNGIGGIYGINVAVPGRPRTFYIEANLSF